MTRSTTKKLTKPLDEPEREFRRLRRASWRQQQNESLAIAGRNLFDDEASSSNNTGAKPLVPSKTLKEHSLPRTCTFQGLKSKNPIHHIKHYLSIVDNIQADDATKDTSRLCFFHFSLKGKAKEWLNKIPPTQITTWYQLVARFLDYFFLLGRTLFLRDMILRFKQGNNKPIKSTWIRFQDLIKQVPHHGIQKWLLVQIFHDNISQKDRGKLDQFAHFRINSLTKEENWKQIEEYVQYQDDLWDDPSPPMNISSISGVIQPTFRGCLKRVCMQISHLEVPHREIGLRNPYLICDFCGGAHEADECDQNNPTEQVCLSGGDIYDDPSLLRFYQNDDVPPCGNNRRKEVGESGPDWVVRSKFEDELAGFMLEKKFHTKGLGEMLDQHRRGIHEQFSQILSEIGSSISINRGLIQAILTSLPPQPIGEVTKASNLRIIPPGVQGRSHFTYFLYLIVQNTNPVRYGQQNIDDTTRERRFGHNNLHESNREFVFNEWILDSYNVEEEYAREIGDLYSRRFNEYNRVFNNEIEHLSNEYILRNKEMGYVWIMYGKLSTKNTRKPKEAWHDVALRLGL
ncbi:reverse transcriptase [Tanacetum coccineum]